MKPIWVFVAGTYRTGSTTQYQMVRDVIQATKSGIGIGYHNERRLRDFDALDWHDLEYFEEVCERHEIGFPREIVSQCERQQPYIVCKVFEYLPDGFRDGRSHGELLYRQKRIQAIVSVRDPRDIATSMKRREEQRSDDGRKDGEAFDFESLVTEKFPIWLGALMKWADLGMVSKFEEFIVNLYGEVLRIADHLELDIDNDTTRRIADDYEIDAIRKRKDEYWHARRDNPDLREDAALPSIPALLFASSGQWRNELTDEQAQMVYDANKEFFKRFGYD